LGVHDPAGEQNVEIQVSVPAGRTLSSISGGPAGGTCTVTGSSASCAYPTLAPGTYNFVAHVLAGTSTGGHLSASYLIDGTVVDNFTEPL
jgi:hypothetical protein